MKNISPVYKKMSAADLKASQAFAAVEPDMMRWRGDWGAPGAYQLNDVVLDASDAYICINPSGIASPVQPSADPANWQPLSSTAGGGGVVPAPFTVDISPVGQIMLQEDGVAQSCDVAVRSIYSGPGDTKGAKLALRKTDASFNTLSGLAIVSTQPSDTDSESQISANILGNVIATIDMSSNLDGAGNGIRVQGNPGGSVKPQLRLVDAGMSLAIDAGAAGDPQVFVAKGATQGRVYDAQFNPPVVRYTSTQTLTLAPYTEIGYNPYTMFTINLPQAFDGCNVFTFYIRSISGTITTASVPPVDFILYPSDTMGINISGVGAWNTAEGAMSKVAYTGLNTGSPFSSNNVIWNWRPTAISGNNIYINAFLTSGGQTLGTNNLEIVLDIVGEKSVLV